MSADTREDILRRLVEVLQTGVPGLRNVFRDRDQMKKDMLPAAVVLDGSEQLFGSPDQIQTRDGKMPPVVMTMMPQIWLSVIPRDKVDNLTVDGVDNPVGEELSAFRMLIRAAVDNDPTLLALLTQNGQLVYMGCETDMTIGSSIKGNMMLQYHIRYVLMPSRG